MSGVSTEVKISAQVNITFEFDLSEDDAEDAAYDSFLEALKNSHGFSLLDYDIHEIEAEEI